MSVLALGRDLLTQADGHTVLLDSSRLSVGAEYLGQAITSITADPPHPGLEVLVGVRAFSGFRSAVGRALPGEAQTRSLRHQLLDDLPGALLVSGRALRAAGVPIHMKGPVQPRTDICAGWVTGGTLLAGWTEDGPPLFPGPPAPALEPEDDALAWHEHGALPAHATRRRRRLDVFEEDGAVLVDCLLRDSHVDHEGLERVVHEYSVSASFDPATRSLTSCEANAGPLPYPECPGAAASAGRVAGAPVEGLRALVRESFVGPTTCSHLNDTLRSLEDVGALVSAMLDPPRVPS